MASFVNFARKHNPNPKTKAQERESNHGGKLADDHFERLFHGGAVKIAQPTGVITAAALGVMGSGPATIFPITSDTVDGPPTQTSMDVTIYNPYGVAYSAADVLVVVDTGRFYVVMVKSL